MDLDLLLEDTFLEDMTRQELLGFAFYAAFAVFMAVVIFREIRRHSAANGLKGGAKEEVMESLHLDLSVQDEGIETKVMLTRAITYLAWLLGFVALAAVFGMLPGVFLFVILYMRIEGKEPWKLTMSCAVGLVLFAWFLFDNLLALPWPQTVIGDIIPALKGVVPSI
jgi:hypothetical protein